MPISASDPSSDTTGDTTGDVDEGEATPVGESDDRGLAPVPGASYGDLPVGSIRPNPKQPRSAFDEDAMAELVHSIREIGVLQPIVVRPIPAGQGPDQLGSAAEGVRYELIMGERRWRASQAAGRDTVPAIVKETEDDDLLRVTRLMGASFQRIAGNLAHFTLDRVECLSFPLPNFYRE